jgi:AcrR family transcriptional regulator
MTALAAPLKPRKQPVQARSAATIDALHTAVIQVLIREGLSRCTTTRIAERAGMSVGSVYQYYPNRDALLAAVLERHLSGIADAMEQVCLDSRGLPVVQMASALVEGYMAAKLRDAGESRALYAVAGERGGFELAGRVYTRIEAAVTVLLTTAPDATFEDPAMTASIALNALVGPVRSILDRQATPAFEARLQGQLVLLLTAYLESGKL